MFEDEQDAVFILLPLTDVPLRVRDVVQTMDGAVRKVLY